MKILLTKKQMAEHFNVSERTINRWMVEKGMPHTVENKNFLNEIRFDSKEVEEWASKKMINSKTKFSRGRPRKVKETLQGPGKDSESNN